jgi:anti-sigma28 factor (negative regulator of flagellin synthesis)
MKIQSGIAQFLQSFADPSGAAGAARRTGEGSNKAAQEAAGADPAAVVSLSPDAQLVQSIATAPQESSGIREDLVAEVQAQLAAGTFEQSVDMDKVLDSLLADL